MLSALLIAGCLLAPAQVIDLGPDAAADEALEQLDEYAPTAPDPATAESQPSTPETIPAAAEPLPATAEIPPALAESLPATAAAGAAEEIEEDETEPAADLGPTAERARYLMFGGLGVGGVGLIGAVAFFTVGLIERLNAQRLLDSSPAFGKQGDRTIVRDASHADVAAYDGHRATSSVMTQLVWISLGVSAVGAAVAAVSYWFGDDGQASAD